MPDWSPIEGVVVSQFGDDEDLRGDGQFSIWTIDLGNSVVTQLTNLTEEYFRNDGYPASFDGKKIAYETTTHLEVVESTSERNQDISIA